MKTPIELYELLSNSGFKWDLVETFEGLRTINVMVDEIKPRRYDVDYAGAGEDGVHQYIIVHAKSRDEYVDPHGDRLSFPTEDDAWEHINTLSEAENNV